MSGNFKISEMLVQIAMEWIESAKNCFSHLLENCAALALATRSGKNPDTAKPLQYGCQLALIEKVNNLQGEYQMTPPLAVKRE